MYTADSGFLAHSGKTSFSYGDLSALLGQIMVRHERNTGHMTHVLRTIKREGSYDYRRGVEVSFLGILPFVLRIRCVGQDRYRVSCTANCLAQELARANRNFRARTNQVAPKSNRKVMRKRISNVLPLVRPKPKKLRMQFSHTEMTWAQALSFIADAHGMTERSAEIRRQMKREPYRDTEIYMVERHGITMGIELIGAQASLPSSTDSVHLWCEKNNKHKCYRRLRNKLRQTFHLSDKAKRKQAKEIKRMRQWRTRQRLLFAVKQ